MPMLPGPLRTTIALLFVTMLVWGLAACTDPPPPAPKGDGSEGALSPPFDPSKESMGFPDPKAFLAKAVGGAAGVAALDEVTGLTMKGTTMGDGPHHDYKIGVWQDGRVWFEDVTEGVALLTMGKECLVLSPLGAATCNEEEVKMLSVIGAMLHLVTLKPLMTAPQEAFEPDSIAREGMKKLYQWEFHSSAGGMIIRFDIESASIKKIVFEDILTVIAADNEPTDGIPFPRKLGFIIKPYRRLDLTLTEVSLRAPTWIPPDPAVTGILKTTRTTTLPGGLTLAMDTAALTKPLPALVDALDEVLAKASLEPAGPHVLTFADPLSPLPSKVAVPIEAEPAEGALPAGAPVTIETTEQLSAVAKGFRGNIDKEIAKTSKAIAAFAKDEGLTLTPTMLLVVRPAGKALFPFAPMNELYVPIAKDEPTNTP